MDNPTSPSDVPPQLTNPPLITPPTSRPRRSWGWIIVSIVLLVLLVCSVLLNFGQAVSLAVSGIGGGFNSGFKSSSTRVAGPRLDEFILEDNGGRSKIASIAVDGIIASATGPSGNTLVQVIQAQLDRAADDKKVKAVILRVDSPGGEVMASDEINKAIVKFQNDSGQTRGVFDGQPRGERWLLHCRALPVYCRKRPDHHRQHRRHHARLQLSRADGQGRRFADDPTRAANTRTC